MKWDFGTTKVLCQKAFPALLIYSAVAVYRTHARSSSAVKGPSSAVKGPSAAFWVNLAPFPKERAKREGSKSCPNPRHRRRTLSWSYSKHCYSIFVTILVCGTVTFKILFFWTLAAPGSPELLVWPQKKVPNLAMSINVYGKIWHFFWRRQHLEAFRSPELLVRAKKIWS